MEVPFSDTRNIGRSLNLSPRTVSVLSSTTLVCVLVLLAACVRIDKYKFFLPKGYSGWVGVEFKNPSHPKLKEEKGWNLVIVSSSGTVPTSSAPPEKYFVKEVYFYDPSKSDSLDEASLEKFKEGGPVQIFEGMTRYDNRTNTVTSYFFIGTASEYAKAPKY
jgi:hypothetical protein